MPATSKPFALLSTRPIRASIVLAVLAAAAAGAGAVPFAAHNLVSDDTTLIPADLADPSLLNAWGVAYSASSPFWVSSNGAGVSNIYRVNPLTQAVTKVGLTVSIPGAGNVTGQVFNPGGAGQFNGDTFLFVGEDGTVSGWRSALGSAAEPLAGLSAYYKGAAYGGVGGNSYLYAADFHGGTVNVLKGSIGAPVLGGSFADPTLPAGFAPFNVQTLGSSLYVAYAMQDPTSPDEVAGPGLGYVNRFDLEGHLLGRIAGGGTLNAPWGLAIAPSSFGADAGSLLVGNFGDGKISMFDPVSGTFRGMVQGASGDLSIDGLWALIPGNGVGGGSTSMLYFSAGPMDEAHGVFGVLASVPETSTALMLAAGLGSLAILLRRRQAS